MSEPFQAFDCSEIGLTMGETKVRRFDDGHWEATCPIGSIFGHEVEGECKGSGATMDEALKALAKDRHELNESLWY
jgi:hypothetical protein